MDTQLYIRQVLTEHLLSADYKQLTETEARQIMGNVTETLKKLITEYKETLSKAEYTFFQRNIHSYHRIPIFYGLPKVHKTPVTLRPIVSGSNSFLGIFSTWLDFKMKLLLPYVKSFIKNSAAVIQDIKQLPLPPHALLFSADATAMFTNIDTQLGVCSIRDFILKHRDKLPVNFQTDLFLRTLTLIMENNVFTFANTHWLQLAGTAMGTPVACAYATVSFGHYENEHILTEFKSNLLYYKRYIDDIIGIWVPSYKNDNTTWNSFKSKLNSWGTLKWVIEEPSKSTHFLDLNISIADSSFNISTFQKPLNLYLYIPPLSAHPPSCFKGLIHGETKRYWTQNNPSDFTNILSKFMTRLVQRGHTPEALAPLLLQAATGIENAQASSNTDVSSNTLYLHWTYNPNGIQSNTIRYLYNKILQPYVPFDRMQIALSRPKNLRDLLT